MTLKNGIAFLALLLLVGCVSARMSDHKSNQLFREQRFTDAADSLLPGLKEQGQDGRDLLLYLLDLGLAYHSAGQYEKSNEYLLKAEKIAEIKDYTSLATEGATLLVSENIKDYKGEDFEKVLINVYLSLNFTLMGNDEAALVEARKVNRKLYLMVTEGERKYKQNAFARYLSAVLYEQDQNDNDAYIDYKKTFELMPEFPELKADLYKMALKLGIEGDAQKWKEKFELAKEQILAYKDELKSKDGQIVIIYQNGISPFKAEHPNWHSIPKFYPRYNPAHYAKVWVDGKLGCQTALLHDIEQTAISNLDEKYAGIIAKKVAGVVAKEVAGNQVERITGSPLIGFLAKIIMHASDRADLRSWNLLPRDLQICKIRATPGLHTIKIEPEGQPLLAEKSVQVNSKKNTFLNFRYMP